MATEFIATAAKTLLAIGTLVASSAAAYDLGRPLLDARLPAPSDGIAPAPIVRTLTRVNADSLARTIASRDAFRLSRAPAATRYDVQIANGTTVAPPPAQRPGFTLVGVLTGVEPQALVDGLPGSETTRVLRRGERAGDYVVQRIGGDSIVLAARDTTWTLHVRKGTE